MAKRPPITETVQQILREAPGPLSVDEVAAQLEARLPGASKNYKNSVRNTLANNRFGVIVRLPDGRLGLKARLVDGASLRHILHDEDLAERELPIGAALADLLDPVGGLAGSGGALRLELAGGPQILGRLDAELGERLLDAGPAFWDWLDSRGAASGDSLIVTALDADARRYGLRHEPAAARDEATIAARNQEVLAAAVGLLRRARGRSPLWEIVANLNAAGALHHPTPPDPFEDLWTEEVYGPVQDEYGVDFPLTGGEDSLFAGLAELLGGRDLDLGGPPSMGPTEVEIGPEDLPPGVTLEELSAKLHTIYTPQGLRPIPADDPLLPAIAQVAARSGLPSPTGAPYRASELQSLFGSDADTLDWIDEGIALGMVAADEAYDPLADDDEETPPDMPAAYAPTGARRRPQPSPQGRKGPVKTYVLRLTYAQRKGFSRDIEIADDQNLEDLHLAIQQALGWDDDHLYSFFMGRRPYDRANEVGSPWSDSARRTYQVSVGSLGLKAKQKFLYLFDYGDEHLFTLEVLQINPQAPRGNYPKVVAREGRAPRQY
mgnify:CR=1 FL=1|nr:plasmid pRiA4b ORF-3 family protein [Chloroflexaceae bacterium]